MLSIAFRSHAPRAVGRRFSTQVAKVGVALDIDGVLLRGYDVIPGAKESLRILQERQIPHVFMTNGGGVPEADKAEQLSGLLESRIKADQVILSHSPMRSLAAKYGDKRCMILGHKKEFQVATNYGFKKIVSPQQLVAQHPLLSPYRSIPKDTPADPFESEPIAAIMIMHDPVDWHLELQVCSDVLLGRDPMALSNSTQVAFFNSNDDLVWAAQYEAPRFGQGAFVKCLEALYTELSEGKVLKVERFGKPYPVTYRYAEELLAQQQGPQEQSGFDCIFGIGDNPASDIRGANAAGDRWKSVLVRTGVFQGIGNSSLARAEYVCGDVLEAVQIALRFKGGN